MSIFENNKNSIKPIKIFLKSSNTTNNLDNPEEKNTIKENSPQIPEQNINQILHETKLRQLEILHQELKEIENENETIKNQILSEKMSEIKLQDKYNKLNVKYKKAKWENQSDELRAIIQQKREENAEDNHKK